MMLRKLAFKFDKKLESTVVVKMSKKVTEVNRMISLYLIMFLKILTAFLLIILKGSSLFFR